MCRRAGVYQEQGKAVTGQEIRGLRERHHLAMDIGFMIRWDHRETMNGNACQVSWHGQVSIDESAKVGR